MKRSNWVRLIAVILIISMLAAPVSAATNRGSDGVRANGLIGTIVEIIRDIIRDIFDDWFDKPGDGEPVPTEPIETTAPTAPGETEPTEPGETEPGETKPTTPGETKPTEPGETEPDEPELNEPPQSPDNDLELIEGHANTANGHLLRGVTYSLANIIAQQGEPLTTATANRFGTKLGNSLGGNAISTSLKTMAVKGGVQTMATTETTVSDTAITVAYDESGNATIPSGDYVIYSSGNAKYLTNTVASSDWGTYALRANASSSEAAIWTLTRQDNGSYTIQDSTGMYLNITGRNSAGLSSTAVYMRIFNNGGTPAIEKLDAANEYDCLNALGGTGYSFFGGWSDGSPVSFYPVTTTEPEVPEVPEIPEEPEQPESAAELVYFPVTMFNYDGATINGYTDDLDNNGTTVREGFYFSDGGSELGSVSYESSVDLSAYVDGNYYIQNFRAKDNNVDSWLYYNSEGANNRRIHSTTQANAQIWTLTNKGNNQVTLSYVQDNTTYYMTIGDGTSGVTTTETLLTLVPYSHSVEGIQIKGTEYLCQFGGSNVTVYGGYEQSNDQGNGMAFFAVSDDGTVASESIEVNSATTDKIISGYERWNWWSYLSGSNNAQNKFYAGLVEDRLDENNNIVFTVNEPGIFTFDASNPTVTNDEKKDIYQNVGLPFVKNEKGYYTFDSDAHGTYFADTNNDGESDPWYGASDDYFNMFFDYQNTQGWADKSNPNSNLGYGDKSKNLWAPYNTNANDTGAGAIDYHFGMRADIPFSMTPNGCIKSTDDNSDHITFTFAGDDDVWIFIDGHLVIDLGGIHNRIGATIDFAANTITYFRPESNAQTLPIGSYNTPDLYPLNEDGTITVKLYNDTNGEGALGQTRFDFSSDEEHEMSIFYLERGKGTSNCKIEFNLPMRDTLLITKDATMSWSAEQDAVDGDKDGTVELTPREQAAVDNILFGFTLYKKEGSCFDENGNLIEDAEFAPVVNTNFFIQDKEGNIVGHGSTDGNGHFNLKNGQTAKFMTDFPKEGVTYYVVEDAVPQGFLTPDYNYAGVATQGFRYAGQALDVDSEIEDATKFMQGYVADASLIEEHELPMNAAENKSYVITAYGSVESIDSLEFIAVNYLDQRLPNPSAIANEDIIVIDYGLPVQIDPLANDVFRGKDVEIVAWGDETLELNEVMLQGTNSAVDHESDAENKTSWTAENRNFHSGTVTFNDVTYAEHEHKTENEDGTTTTTYTYTRDSFEYKLTKQLTEVEVISYIIKVTSDLTNNVTGQETTACRYSLAKVYIVPATIMYYEENFSDMIHFEGSGWDKDYTTANQGNVSPHQEPGVVGTIGDSTYGSDLAYLSDDGDSNGTYRFGNTTQTVDEAGNKTGGAIRFTYTFTGTGTSIFARTSAKTGYMQVKLYPLDENGDVLLDEDGNKILEEMVYRDTYWKYLNENNLAEGDCLYNIPVYTSNENLAYGTYMVVCTVAKAGTLTEGNPNGAGNEFYLDGIRVMQPLDDVFATDPDSGECYKKPIEDVEPITAKALEAYATDGEANLDVVTLRQKLITDHYYEPEEGEENTEEWPFAVLTDVDGNIVMASDYVSIGPKEEVYLSAATGATNAQSVSFSLKYWETEGLKLYMGMKAPFGQAKVHVGAETIELFNAPDCYYDVTKSASVVEETDEDGNTYFVATFTFTAAESIVSLTNIKVVGTHEFVIIENTDQEIDGNEGGNA